MSMRSMFAGVSGLRAHQVMMDVVGNNIANVNTIGFKASRVVFQDTLYQMTRGESGGTGESLASVNPQQVGLGVKVASIDPIFTQGASQLTGRATDVAIQGDGFYVMRVGSEIQYTRAGSFSFDNKGFLNDPGGAIVQGWLADTNGNIFTNAPTADIQLPVGKVLDPIATTAVKIAGNLSASTAPASPPDTTAIEIIDSLGAKHRVSYEFTKTANPNEWDFVVKDPAGAQIGATIQLQFDSSTGKLTSPVAPPSYNWTPPGGAAAMTFSVDFGAPGASQSLTQFGGESTAAAVSQDGAMTGYLRSFAISDDGSVSGVFSNGVSQPLARIAIANFNNPTGLVKAGQSLWRASSASGQPIVGPPGEAGRGDLSAGTVEMSNVDLASEFTTMIIAQRGFQANSRIISASDEMLQDLVNLVR